MEGATLPVDAAPASAGVADQRMRELIERREAALGRTSRGWLVPRMLLLADVLGLALAFLIAQLLYGREVSPNDGLSPGWEFAVFFLTLPAWIVGAKMYELYDSTRSAPTTRPSTRSSASSTSSRSGPGSSSPAAWLRARRSELARLVASGSSAIVFVTAAARVGAGAPRRSPLYLQNTIISAPATSASWPPASSFSTRSTASTSSASSTRTRGAARHELEHLALLGAPEQLAEIIELLDVERVIIAFSDDAPRGAARHRPRAAEARRPDRHRPAAVRDRRPEGRHPHARGSRAGRAAAGQRLSLVPALKRALDILVAFRC